MSRRDAVVAYLLQPEHGIPLSALDRHDDARRVPLMNEVTATHRGGLAEGRHRRLAPRRDACSGEPSSITSEPTTSRHDNTPLADACKFRHRRAAALLVAAGARLGLRPLRLAGILCALVKARCSRDHGRSREV